ncbi:MAG TPA: MBL fold metallo-hydrolase, partial [Phototrophicaceae bacterium]|nr:MBL fold metallo-hydrolase [Phototrophicaceae bacterium]
AASPDAKLILPQAAVNYAVALGVPSERLIAIRGDETFGVGNMIVHSIPAAHPGLDYTETDGYSFLGYVFQVDGVTLYHSGDTLAYEGLADKIKQFQPDVILLPINGTNETLLKLNIAPNMNSAEAVALAKSIGTAVTIPNHYDLFDFNTADVHDFVTLATAEGLPHQVLHCGERWIWQHP